MKHTTILFRASTIVLAALFAFPAGAQGLIEPLQQPAKPGEQVLDSARVAESYDTLSPYQANNSSRTATVAGAILYAPVNSADYQQSIAPGSLVTFFGRNLTTATQSFGGTVPLPTSLGAISMTMNNSKVPLLYVSPTQINAQIPVDVAPGAVHLRMSSPSGEVQGTITVSAVAPAIWTGDGVTAISGRQGDWVTIYATGQGPLASPIPSGHAAPTTHWIQPTARIRVFSGNTELECAYAMLPGFIGILQINIKLAASTPAGRYQIAIAAGNTMSKTMIVELR
jgi:uncharacterized protein (TIGR03437 family)